MGFKHMVDRYNIYFAYKPSRISKGIHSTAINFVVAAVILLQCNIAFFTAIRSGNFFNALSVHAWSVAILQAKKYMYTMYEPNYHLGITFY